MSDLSLCFQALSVEDHGFSRVLGLLNYTDLIACAGTCHYIRNLALALMFRDCTFKIFPELEDLTASDDDGAKEEEHAHHDSEDGSDDPASEATEEASDGDDEDAASSSSKNGTGDDAANLVVSKSLEGVLEYLSHRAYVLQYVSNLDLRVQRLSGSAPLYSNARTFLEILHLLPNLENLWLVNVLLTGDAGSTAALLTALVLTHISLRHLCIDVTSYKYNRKEAPPGLLRNLLTPFGTVDDLRMRHWIGLPDEMDPLPEHLEIRGLTVEDNVAMRSLFAALVCHPLIDRLRALDFQEDIAVLCNEPHADDVRWSPWRLLDVVGPNLEHFGFGTLTLDKVFKEEGYPSKRAQERAFVDAVETRLCASLRPETLRSLAVHVFLWGDEQDDALKGALRGPNIWSEACHMLALMRDICPDRVEGVRTIHVKINAWRVYDADEFGERVAAHKPLRLALQKELLSWMDELYVEEVVVEFLDMSDFGFDDLHRIVTKGPQLIFPKLHKRGYLRHQDVRLVEEHWRHRSEF